MILDVRDYGATGDGVTDDTAAVQSALNTVSGVLYFPAGTYRTTSPLTANPRRVAIRGDGSQSSIIAAELQPGQYALTLGWDANVAQKWGPIDAVAGLMMQGTAGNGIHMQGSGANPQAQAMTLRDVGFHGFDVQVDLGNYVFLTRFDRCFFVGFTTYGVRLDNVSTSGENVSFAGCSFADGAGTAVYTNTSGASLHFSQCSFDYCKRVAWQRAGSLTFSACHFEADATYGPGGEYLLLDRRGEVSRPLMALTDCDLYDGWDNYDTFIRLRGTNGDQGLRLVNLYMGPRSAGGCLYLIRDDGPWPSSVHVSGLWYARGDFPARKMRKQDGTDLVLNVGPDYVL